MYMIIATVQIILLGVLLPVIAKPLDIKAIEESLFEGYVKRWSLAAIADFNGDKSTDVFVVNEERSVVQVILMADFGFTRSEKLHPKANVTLIDESILPGHKKIKSVIPGDFNNDKKMDFYLLADDELLVFFCKCNSSAAVLMNCKPKNIKCEQGNFKVGKDKELPSITVSDEPMLLDLNSDWVPDIIVKDKNGLRAFLGVSNSESVNEDKSEKFITFAKTPIKTPMTNTFAPLNEDLHSDILLGSDIYLSSSNGTFRHSQSLPEFPPLTISGMPLAVGIQNPVQQLDLLVPACNSSSSQCEEGTGSLKWLTFQEGMTWNDAVISKSSTFEWIFPSPTDSDTPYPAVRAGDYDLDGYEDLVGVVSLKTTDKSKKQIPVKTIVLFHNTGTCESSKRCFEMIDLLQGRRHSDLVPLVATFIDVTPDARLAVIATFRNQTSNGLQLKAYQIAATADSAFLKLSISLNQKSEEITASNLPGVNVQCKISSKLSSIPLLQRSSHLALGLPYAVIGLGQLPPFVDMVAVQMSSRAGLFKHQLIIPNSQLVLIADPDTDPLVWPLKSFLLLNWYMFAVLGLLGILTICSLGLLGGLHIRDKRIEKREKEEEAQQFHFDGM